MTELALKLEGVTKTYGDFVAVGDISLEIPQGVICGILGPNGAGKTTILRMINDIIRPDAGHIEILGSYGPGPLAARKIGYLPEERGLYPKMKVGETLSFFAQLRGLSKKESLAQADLWLERLRIRDWRGNKVQDLSKGMQQKVQFAASLIHDPELLILDEPWSGLDPINAEVLRDVVLAQRDAGRTVLFSTHLMEQAEKICEYVCIIARGRKALDGSLPRIKREAAEGGWIRLRFMSESDLDRAKDEVLGHQIQRMRSIEDGVEVTLMSGGTDSELLHALLKEGIAPSHFERLAPSLHQIFVDRVGEEAGTDVEGRRTDD